MKKITLKYKVFFIAFFGIIGAFSPMIAGAVVPDTAGVIYACKADMGGLLRLEAQPANCPTGESSVQWDRGMIGFAYAPHAVDSDKSEFSKGNVPVSITNVYHDGITNACVDMPTDIANNTRFVTVDGSANDFVLRDDDISSSELDQRCGSSYEGLMKSQTVSEGTTLMFY